MCRHTFIYIVSLCFIFIFSLIFIAMDQITPLKQTYLFSVHFLEYILLFLDDNVDETNKFSNSKNSASGCC